MLEFSEFVRYSTSGHPFVLVGCTVWSFCVAEVQKYTVDTLGYFLSPTPNVPAEPLTPQVWVLYTAFHMEETEQGCNTRFCAVDTTLHASCGVTSIIGRGRVLPSLSSDITENAKLTADWSMSRPRCGAHVYSAPAVPRVLQWLVPYPQYK